MTKIGVLIPSDLRNALFHASDQSRLEGGGEVRWNDAKDHLTSTEAARFLTECDVALGSWGTATPSEALLRACPKLKLWMHAAGTVKKFWGPQIDRRGLVVASCAPAIADCVAEMVLGELILGLKRVIENAQANRGGIAGKPRNSRTLARTVIGVVGASFVGREVIRLLKLFGPHILLYDPFVSEGEAETLEVEKVDQLADLCARSNAVTLHTPALPTTRHIMGRAQFQAMADDAVFINTSRGHCVDESALVEELSKNRLFAFIDVTAPEPAATDSPLRGLPNAFVTSHIAGGHDYRIGKQAVDDILAFLQGGTPRLVVTRGMFDRIA